MNMDRGKSSDTPKNGDHGNNTNHTNLDPVSDLAEVTDDSESDPFDLADITDCKPESDHAAIIVKETEQTNEGKCEAEISYDDNGGVQSSPGHSIGKTSSTSTTSIFGRPQMDVKGQGVNKVRNRSKILGFKIKKKDKGTKICKKRKGGSTRDKRECGDRLDALFGIFGGLLIILVIILVLLLVKTNEQVPHIAPAQETISPNQIILQLLQQSLPADPGPGRTCPPENSEPKTCSCPEVKSDLKEKDPDPPKNCLEIQRRILFGRNNDDQDDLDLDLGQGSKSSSWQTITPLESIKKEVLCDFETVGGGWTVIQQRMPGAPQTLFYRNWRNYEQGFGVNDSYWLGLEVIHALTMDTPATLLIELTDWAGETRWAEYRSFKVESADDAYRLRVSGYSGDAGDSLTYHNDQQFSTMDWDNDARSILNCARHWNSGWWFNSCAESNLNGIYWDDLDGTRAYENINKGDGVTWNSWTGQYYSLKSVTMKIRPANFNPNRMP